jgi:large subunit ribosomal protein L4
MELAVYNINGKKTTKKVELSDSIFGIEPNDHAIYLDVKQIMANKRQGTHKTKEKGEITGSTRKIKRQKGTGTARMGSIKSGVLRGGGRIFGPQPRDYSFKLNKKLKKLARKSALAYKAKQENIIVLEDFSYDAPKTKQFVELLNNFEIANTKVLVIMTDVDGNMALSARNIQTAKVVKVENINTYDILNASKLLICESSVSEFDNIFSVN